MNKHGGIGDIFVFMTLAFAFVVIAGIFIYIGHNVQTNLKLNPPSTANFNNSFYNQTVDNTIGTLATAYDSLKWLTYLIIGGMALSIFIGAFVIRSNPAYFIIYIIITIIAVISSVPLSNAYETLLSNGTLGTTFLGFTGSNYILLHLPMWVGIIGLIGAIVLFGNMVRDGGQYVSG